jgi:hypothetical protein
MVAAACSRAQSIATAPGSPGLYSFEDGLIPSALSPAGASGWYVVNESSSPYTKALRAPAIGNSQTTQFTFQISTTGVANNFKIRYRTSSENNYDFFYVFIDGTQVVKASGDFLVHVNYVGTVSAGVHTVVIRYSKDNTTINGSDTVFIPFIEWA